MGRRLKLTPLDSSVTSTTHAVMDGNQICFVAIQLFTVTITLILSGMFTRSLCVTTLILTAHNCGPKILTSTLEACFWGMRSLIFYNALMHQAHTSWHCSWSKWQLAPCLWYLWHSEYFFCQQFHLYWGSSKPSGNTTVLTDSLPNQIRRSPVTCLRPQSGSGLTSWASLLARTVLAMTQRKCEVFHRHRYIILITYYMMADLWIWLHSNNIYLSNFGKATQTQFRGWYESLWMILVSSSLGYKLNHNWPSSSNPVWS